MNAELNKKARLGDGGMFGASVLLDASEHGSSTVLFQGNADMAARVMACWNACHGIPTEALAGENVAEAMMKAANTEDQLRAELVAAFEATQDMRATAEAAMAERNLAVAALQAALGESSTANAQLFDLAVNKDATHAVRDGIAASAHLLALQRDVRQALHKLGAV